MFTLFSPMVSVKKENLDASYCPSSPSIYNPDAVEKENLPPSANAIALGSEVQSPHRNEATMKRESSAEEEVYIQDEATRTPSSRTPKAEPVETPNRSDIDLQLEATPEMRRLSKRLSLTNLPVKAGYNFHRDGDAYKLYVSNQDRAQPFTLKAASYDKLYDYQKDGLKWLWERFCSGAGGLLGDDMGLGKTIQIITFLDGMFHAQRIRYALIAMPVSLLEVWSNEIEQWAPRLLVERLHDVSVDRRRRLLRQLRLYGGVCLTSYGMITSSVAIFQEAGIEWDYVILDEGHKIKDPRIRLSRNVRLIPARHRLILSGTPVQNNLTELWSLFDFICKGRLLGSQKEFKELIADKISRGNERCATQYDKIRGEEMARTLRRLIRPFFLRREKSLLMRPSHDLAPQPASFLSTAKFDFVIWLQMTQVQLDIYEQLLRSTSFIKAMHCDDKKKAGFTAFQALARLKLVCDHPWLLLRRDAMEDAMLHQVKWQGLDGEEAKVMVPIPHDSEEEVGGIGCSMIQDCCKLAFLTQLLTQLHADGHRVLIFSLSLKMLDILEIWLRGMRLPHLRLDGTVKGSSDRQQIVDRFNADARIFACLLTTRVGGIGLTLTGADRVVIVDPDWNPSVDNQAVDRAYRIGQAKDIVVYRLMTCGTLEEKIYRHQVFKQGLAMNATGADSVYRHFTRKDLKEMFTLGVTASSQTADQLYDLNRDQMTYPPSLEQHMLQLRAIPGSANFSDHGLVYDKKEDVGTCPAAQEEAASSRQRLKSSTYEPDWSQPTEAPPSRKRGRPKASDDPFSPRRPQKAPKERTGPAKMGRRKGRPADNLLPWAQSGLSFKDLCRSPPPLTSSTSDLASSSVSAGRPPFTSPTRIEQSLSPTEAQSPASSPVLKSAVTPPYGSPPRTHCSVTLHRSASEDLDSSFTNKPVTYFSPERGTTSPQRPCGKQPSPALPPSAPPTILQPSPQPNCKHLIGTPQSMGSFQSSLDLTQATPASPPRALAPRGSEELHLSESSYEGSEDCRLEMEMNEGERLDNLETTIPLEGCVNSPSFASARNDDECLQTARRLSRFFDCVVVDDSEQFSGDDAESDGASEYDPPNC